MEYMLTQDNLDKWTSHINNVDVKNGSVEDEDDKLMAGRNKIIHIDSMRDKLFWCFFIIIEGIEQYELAKEKTFKYENEFKYKSVYKIKEKLTDFKKHKLKSAELESELVTAKIMNISLLQALAIAYNKSIIYTNDRIYYDFCYGGDDYFLIEKKKGRIFLHTGCVDDKVCVIKDTLHCIDNSKTKSINSVSFYTAKDLHTIADKLHIDKMNSGKPLSKTLLYNEIVIKIEKLT